MGTLPPERRKQCPLNALAEIASIAWLASQQRVLENLRAARKAGEVSGSDPELEDAANDSVLFAQGTHDPGRAELTTFATAIAKRQLGAANWRETQIAQAASESAHSEDGPPEWDPGEPLPLLPEEFLRVHGAARGVLSHDTYAAQLAAGREASRNRLSGLLSVLADEAGSLALFDDPDPAIVALARITDIARRLLDATGEHGDSADKAEAALAALANLAAEASRASRTVGLTRKVLPDVGARRQMVMHDDRLRALESRAQTFLGDAAWTARAVAATACDLYPSALRADDVPHVEKKIQEALADIEAPVTETRRKWEALRKGPVAASDGALYTALREARSMWTRRALNAALDALGYGADAKDKMTAAMRKRAERERDKEASFDRKLKSVERLVPDEGRD